MTREKNLTSSDLPASIKPDGGGKRKGRNFRRRKKKSNEKAKAQAKVVNPFKKLQLSIFNSRFIPIEPNPDNAYGFLPKRPMDFEAFERHINEIRKYECLLKVEFEVLVSMTFLISDLSVSLILLLKLILFDLIRLLLATKSILNMEQDMLISLRMSSRIPTLKNVLVRSRKDKEK